MKIMKIDLHNLTDYEIKDLILDLNEVFEPIVSKSGFQLILVDEKEIQRLNNFFRGTDKSTDVLSFANEESDDESLGDVFVCLSVAARQAHELKQSLVEEVVFLAVHGYLHLIGYDHDTPEKEKIMIAKQNEILKRK